MIRRTFAVALLALTLSAAAWAHDGHAHTVMGTVTARDAKTLQIKTPGGEVLSIALTDKTLVTRSKKKIALAEVKTGLRVVIDIGNGEDPLIAREIQLGAAAVTAK